MICAVEAVPIRIFERKKFSKDRFLSFFTPKELRDNLRRAKPWEALAARLALKRASLKALASAGMAVCPLNQIEVTKNKQGAPTIRFINADHRAALRKNQHTFSVSLSHTHRTGIAVVVMD